MCTCSAPVLFSGIYRAAVLTCMKQVSRINEECVIGAGTGVNLPRYHQQIYHGSTNETPCYFYNVILGCLVHRFVREFKNVVCKRTRYLLLLVYLCCVMTDSYRVLFHDLTKKSLQVLIKWQSML